MSIRRVIFSFFDIVIKVVLVVIAVMFIMRGVGYAYDIGQQIFDQRSVSGPDAQTVAFTVESADSIAEIGQKLKEKGLIEDEHLFIVQERLSLYHDMITPGTYELSPSMTPDEMIAIMAAPAVEQKKMMEEAEKNFEAAAAAQSSEEGTKVDETAAEGTQAGGDDAAAEGVQAGGDDAGPSEQEEQPAPAGEGAN